MTAFYLLAGGVDWLAIAAKTFNIALFLGILAFLLRKPMAAFFDGRLAAIKSDLERAKRERAEAESKLAEVDARLSRLDAEAAEIRAGAQAEAEAEAVRIRERAEEEARKIAETAEREIGGALKTARADLQRFVAEQSVELAESMIRAEINDADRQRIVAQYVEQLEGVKK